VPHIHNREADFPVSHILEELSRRELSRIPHPKSFRNDFRCPWILFIALLTQEICFFWERFIYRGFSVFLGKELSTQLVSMFAVKEMVNILGSLRRNLSISIMISFFIRIANFIAVPKLSYKNGNIQKGNGTILMNISKYFIAHNVLIT